MLYTNLKHIETAAECARIIKENENVMIRTRYRQTLQEAIVKNINKKNNTSVLSIKKPIDIPTSGQSAVIYRATHTDPLECLGGGIIE
jgi:tRNA U34 2-thiouridine synthase MnmA/TrmU